MKVTFERVENGWLITDCSQNEFDHDSIVSVAEDDESLHTEYDTGNYIAESLSRALGQVFGEWHYQSKHQGGLEVIYHPQGREKEDEQSVFMGEFNNWIDNRSVFLDDEQDSQNDDYEKPRVLSAVPICTLCGLGVIDCLHNGVCLDIGGDNEEE